ncbi:protein kinase [Escherichia coli]|uniref:protein kinase n=1 Tax=Escherichia coli TaxID=562 RepID=UPI00227ABC90|nr:protein kinase [Escherichia coli]MCY4689416.1 protein kinase [Escherichia coli]MCY4704981.1 protein kinase [Escherichia coli]MCY4709368.1 protein kinase [Escherichia coli]MCY4713491.1 protein kinase [Escherichia coli]MCY4724455.1 protein kinase [Escherichia coli]
MNYTDIQARLEIIKSLPISDLDKRQPLLVALAADIVNGETCDGNDTNGSQCLEYQDWWNTLGALMRDAGFRMLGNGHFSAAYSHEMLPGRVIKVGFKKEDSGAAYTAFCRMHQGRAGIPNIYHVARHAGCYTVVLDRLHSCDDDNYDHEVYADLARYFVESDCHDASDFAPGDYEFIETCKMIREFFKGIASFDMHSGNIMFDDNDVPYITDPVSFSHDREREDGFPLDPEALLAEVEAVAQERMIERCRNRKAKRDPNGSFQVNRKAAMKRRKRNRKLHVKGMAQFVKGRIERRAIDRNERRAEMLMGSAWNNFWFRNGPSAARKVEQVNGLKWQLGDRLAIQAGLPLNIDKLLDAQLQG